VDSSKDLRRRAFGTAGRRDASEGNSIGIGEVVDLPEEILRRPIFLAGPGAWKPRPGRIYNFPVRKEPEEK
jgi:hypothetical protein